MVPVFIGIDTEYNKVDRTKVGKRESELESTKGCQMVSFVDGLAGIKRTYSIESWKGSWTWPCFLL